MVAAEVQDRLQQRRVQAGTTAAAVIAGGQVGGGPALGLGPQGAADQVAGGARRQAELPSDLGRGDPEASHPGDGQPQG